MLESRDLLVISVCVLKSRYRCVKSLITSKFQSCRYLCHRILCPIHISEMGTTAAKEASPQEVESKSEPEKKLKPCCACPETKRPRDACIIEKGEENCGDLIQAHKECMRKLGFNI